MIKRLLLSALAVVTVLSVSACGGGGGSEDPRKQELRDFMDTFSRDHGIPGVILQVSIPSEGFEFREGRGMADITSAEPVNADMEWRIGSNTKVFTATAVLQLVDQGLVKLTDPIAGYLQGVPSGDRITIRMLLNHTSGLFNYTDDPTIFEDTGKAWVPQEMLSIAFSHPLDFQPGSKYSYSNTNYILLGLLVEAVTGRSLEEELQTRFFDSLGLRRTYMASDGQFKSSFMHGYVDMDGRSTDASNWNPSWAWAAGGMNSTSREMTRWIEAVAGGEFLSPAIQQERFAQMSYLKDVQGHPVYYGLGIAEFNGYVGHNGGLPGYNSSAYHNPALGSTVVFVLNEAKNLDFDFAIGVFNILSGEGANTES